MLQRLSADMTVMLLLIGNCDLVVMLHIDVDLDKMAQLRAQYDKGYRLESCTRVKF